MYCVVVTVVLRMEMKCLRIICKYRRKSAHHIWPDLRKSECVNMLGSVLCLLNMYYVKGTRSSRVESS